MNEKLLEIPLLGPSLALPSKGDKDGVLRMDRFITGAENELISVVYDMFVASSVKENSPRKKPPKAKQYPIILYGPSCCGKTHVAYGLAVHDRKHKITSKRTAKKSTSGSSETERRIHYGTAVDYAREFAIACETNTLSDFHTVTRNCEVFILEDLDKIAKKRAAVEDLCFTLDHLIAQGRFVLITMSAPPSEWRSINSRLAARLTGGLVVPMTFPGQASRRRILQHAASQAEIPLTSDMLDALTEHASGGVPHLMTLLVRLKLYANRNSQPVDATILDRLMEAAREQSRPDPEAIIRAVARQFEVRVKDLKGNSRKRPIVVARAAAMYLLRDLTPLSLNQIGGRFGGKNHKTVTHAVEVTEERLKKEEQIRRAVAEIRRELCG
jgi:chromosomal replication initiator protein